MTLAQRISDRLGVSTRRQRQISHFLQSVLAMITGYGLVTLQFGVALIGGIPFLVSLLPIYFRRDHDIPLDAGWSLWVTVAVVIHAFGALGAYDHAGWYDQVAHAISGALVAACGYVLGRAVALESDEIELSERFLTVFTVVVVLALGVIWELAEFGTEIIAQLVGGEAALVVRSVDDIALDLAFDAVGAIAIASWDARSRTLLPVAAAIAQRIRQ